MDYVETPIKPQDHVATFFELIQARKFSKEVLLQFIRSEKLGNFKEGVMRNERWKEARLIFAEYLDEDQIAEMNRLENLMNLEF